MSHVWKERAQERRQTVLTAKKKKNIRRRLYKKLDAKKKWKKAGRKRA